MNASKSKSYAGNTRREVAHSSCGEFNRKDTSDQNKLVTSAALSFLLEGMLQYPVWPTVIWTPPTGTPTDFSPTAARVTDEV
mmetsp:Transcript_26700/g.56238  ORF Transcript_26700/g.56238 Transcript_26700/m.56238 type:complete len:82 (-) Transcript_26700:663-908(-)